jgi:hypothetical protein
MPKTPIAAMISQTTVASVRWLIGHCTPAATSRLMHAYSVSEGDRQHWLPGGVRIWIAQSGSSPPHAAISTRSRHVLIASSLAASRFGRYMLIRSRSMRSPSRYLKYQRRRTKRPKSRPIARFSMPCSGRGSLNRMEWYRGPTAPNYALRGHVQAEHRPERSRNSQAAGEKPAGAWLASLLQN